jgi:plastocyanin
MFIPILRFSGLCLCVLMATQSCAYDLKVQVVSLDNKPMADAVVYIEATGESVQPSVKIAVMDQQNKAFVPHVLAIPAGTTVDFPNTDTVNHYVYSFSEIKKFQFKLFKGDLEKHQILLDKPGLITIGCNIHDFMLGYIFVAPTPYVGVTDVFFRSLGTT